MRILLIISLWLMVAAAPAQRLTGTWQVVKESNCLGMEMDEPTEAEQELLENMSTLSGNTPKTFRFNDDGTGEENWRTRGKRKSSSKEKFMYRFIEGAVYLLDKKTRLITDTFIVETLTASSLIMFNKDRACERVELARVN